MNPPIDFDNTNAQGHFSPVGEPVRYFSREENERGGLLITGAAGFIGSCLVGFLNEMGYTNLLLCDDFGVEEKRHNWENKQFEHIIERYNLFDWLETHDSKIDFVFHLGARTDTTEFDYAVHQELNVDFTENLWRWCTKNNVPLIYASSAATYGAGELGYEDDENMIPELHPLNPYGVSKNEIDKWVLQQTVAPPFWAGLKFFNVYGPNEGHKGRMASVIWHSFNQIKRTGQVKLFKSHHPDFEDGQQLRDFIYVKDILKVMYWMMESSMVNGEWSINNAAPSTAALSIEAAIADSQMMEDGGPQTIDHRPQPETGLLSIKEAIRNWQITDDEEKPENQSATKSQITNPKSQIPSAIYNLGTGEARSFYDLAVATFRGLDMEPHIVFIDMPEDIRDTYQYFTQADMHKLRAAGYTESFYTLEKGVNDYVRHYLAKKMLY